MSNPKRREKIGCMLHPTKSGVNGIFPLRNICGGSTFTGHQGKDVNMVQ